MHNTSSQHALPAFLGEVSKARWRLAHGSQPPVPTTPAPSSKSQDEASASVEGEASGYAVYNHPLPLTSEQELRVKLILAVLSALFVLIPCCYIPASAAVFVVKERAVKAKHLQLVSGAPSVCMCMYVHVCACMCMALAARLWRAASPCPSAAHALTQTPPHLTPRALPPSNPASVPCTLASQAWGPSPSGLLTTCGTWPCMQSPRRGVWVSSLHMVSLGTLATRSRRWPQSRSSLALD